jgi:membrane-associated protease RseP (regulator of RpoE activity)
MMLQFVGIFIGIAFAIAVHEAGPLFCAIATSIAVRRVTVGVGPLLLRGRIGETRFELRVLPANGFASIFPLGVVRKFRLALFILGGVLANALVLAIMTVLGLAGAFPASVSEWGDFLGPLVLMQAYVMFEQQA